MHLSGLRAATRGGVDLVMALKSILSLPGELFEGAGYRGTGNSEMVPVRAPERNFECEIVR